MGVTFTDATAASGSATGILGSTILQDARLLLNAKTFPASITMTSAGIIQRAQQIVGAGDFPGSISMTGTEVVQQARELLNAVDYPAAITQTAAGMLKWRVSSRTRAMSCAPDRVGSVTTRTRDTPLTDAIAAQPTPGGPSTRTRSVFRSSARVRATSRTLLTSLPEFSAPGISRA